MASTATSTGARFAEARNPDAGFRPIITDTNRPPGVGSTGISVIDT